MSQEYLHPEQVSVTNQVSHQSLLRQSIHHLQTPLILQTDDMGLSTSAETVSTYSGSEYASPTEYSYSARDFGREDPIPFFSGSMRMYNMFPCQTPPIDHGRGTTSYARGPTSYPDQFYTPSEMSSSISSAQNVYDPPEQATHSGSPVDACTLSDVFYDDEILGAQSTHEIGLGYENHGQSKGSAWGTVTDDGNSSHAATEFPSYHNPRIENLSFLVTSNIPPRIAFFLDYYEKIICPTIVVIDSPSNPYRQQILSLAMESKSLQHAICALAACNLRMKRKQSLGQQQWKNSHQAAEVQEHSNNGAYLPLNENMGPSRPVRNETSPDDGTQEESRHQTLAVQLLNQHLSDPRKAKHDAVLATLFILCHYRMCESGIAQIKTQFAGVKKLMGMRGNGLERGRWGWMETLFTYFDAITATVNDREAQLRGGFFDLIAAPSHPSWALENLAGCDGRLFKIIARLGRLNLLSQHRPVLDPPEPPAQRVVIPQTRPDRQSGAALVDFYNLHSSHQPGTTTNNNNNNNDFHHPLPNESAITADHHLGNHHHHHPSSSAPNEDSRPLFWQEWRDIRTHLQNWEFNPNLVIANLPATPTATQLRDFTYISEAFRYAALLYTERLSNPRAAAGSMQFQNLVSQVLFYLTNLSSSHNSSEDPSSSSSSSSSSQRESCSGSGSSQNLNSSRSGCSGRGVEGFLLWPLFVAGSECVDELQRSVVRARFCSCVGRSGYQDNFAGLGLLERMWRDVDRGVERCGGPSVVNGGDGGGAGLGKGWDKPFRWTGYMEGVTGEYIMV